MINTKNFQLPMLVFSIIFPILCYGSNTEFSAGDFEVRVVDAETQEPIEGVLMLTFWLIVPESALNIPLSTESDLSDFWEQIKYWEVKEFLSDQNGWIRYKGWRKNLPKHYAVFELTGDPEFSLYKEGYIDVSFTNIVNREGNFDEYSEFYKDKLTNHLLGEEKSIIKGFPNLDIWNGETIKLYKYEKGLSPTRIEDGSIYIFIRRVISQQDIKCPWVEIPNSLLALLKMNQVIAYESGLIEDESMEMDLESQIRRMMGDNSCTTFEEIKEKYL